MPLLEFITPKVREPKVEKPKTPERPPLILGGTPRIPHSERPPSPFFVIPPVYQTRTQVKNHTELRAIVRCWLQFNPRYEFIEVRKSTWSTKQQYIFRNLDTNVQIALDRKQLKEFVR